MGGPLAFEFHTKRGPLPEWTDPNRRTRHASTSKCPMGQPSRSRYGSRTLRLQHRPRRGRLSSGYATRMPPPREWRRYLFRRSRLALRWGGGACGWQALATALHFLCRPNRPDSARPPAKSGNPAGIGTGETVIIPAPGPLDLDHVSPLQGELHGREGPRDHLREVEHCDPVKQARRHGSNRAVLQRASLRRTGGDDTVINPGQEERRWRR